MHTASAANAPGAPSGDGDGYRACLLGGDQQDAVHPHDGEQAADALRRADDHHGAPAGEERPVQVGQGRCAGRVAEGPPGQVQAEIPAAAVERIRMLLNMHNYSKISEILNEEGYRTAKGLKFDMYSVGYVARSRGWGRSAAGRPEGEV